MEPRKKVTLALGGPYLSIYYLLMTMCTRYRWCFFRFQEIKVLSEKKKKKKQSYRYANKRHAKWNFVNRGFMRSRRKRNAKQDLRRNGRKTKKKPSGKARRLHVIDYRRIYETRHTHTRRMWNGSPHSHESSLSLICIPTARRWRR